MKPKRYYLRGGVIGLLVPLIGAATFTLYLVASGGDPFWTTFGFVYSFLAGPVIIVTVPLGVILGWLYGKIKNRNRV